MRDSPSESNDATPARNRHLFRNFWLVVLIVGIIGGYFALRNQNSSDSNPSSTVTPSVTPTVVGVQDLCRQFYDTLIRTIDARVTGTDVSPLFRALAQAARPLDVVIASEVQAIVDSRGPADVSANMELASRRCTALGHPPTPEQRGKLSAASTVPLPGP